MYIPMLNKRLIKALAVEPSYLFVLALAVVVVEAVLGSRPLWVTAPLVVLAALALVLVEWRRRLAFESPEQKKRLGVIAARDTPIQKILGHLVSPVEDTYFVYSATRVRGFVDQRGQPIPFAFSQRELQVTAIPDAQGIAMIHSLLYIAEKHDRLRVLTSGDFLPEYWDANLILIGSGNANGQTDDALSQCGAPFGFDSTVTAIVDRQATAPSVGWPTDPSDLQRFDYAVLTKLRKLGPAGSFTYLVVAGIGAIGTLAACYYLQHNIVSLSERFGDSPFGCVLKVDRQIGHTSVEEVASRSGVRT